MAIKVLRQYKWFFAFVVASLVFQPFLYVRMKNAEKNLEDYFQAKDCPSQENCRQKVKATILECKGLSVYIKGVQFKYGGHSPSGKSAAYNFLISSPIGTQEVVISANPTSYGVPFDMQNVVIPTGRDSHFISENFFNGKTSFVEIWRGQITVLYTDKIIDIPDIVIPPTPIPGLNTQTFIEALPPKTYDTALPVETHPIFLDANAHRDFYGSLFVTGIITIWGGAIVLATEIQKAKKKSKEEK